MRTYSAKTDEVTHKWFVVDVAGKILGRQATEIARILRGKNKPQFTPHADTGDFVVVINADKVQFTGKKWEKKKYYRHSGYVGGLKTVVASEMREKYPERIIRHAVQGMLPKNTLGRKILKKLKIYVGSEHPHQAQQPTLLEI